MFLPDPVHKEWRAPSPPVPERIILAKFDGGIDGREPVKPYQGVGRMSFSSSSASALARGVSPARASVRIAAIFTSLPADGARPAAPPCLAKATLPISASRSAALICQMGQQRSLISLNELVSAHGTLDLIH